MKTKKKTSAGRTLLLLAAVLAAVLIGLYFFGPAGGVDDIEDFAKEHGIPLALWPKEMVELLQNNPETKEFVLRYPLRKRIQQPYSMEEFIGTSEVPLLLQWDTRWGYHEYGNQVMGLSGCGPTCLSMVCLYLMEDGRYDPAYVADFSAENGYYVPGTGSSWTLISEGGRKLGLDVVELPLVESLILRNLEVGNPIICAMGPGDFTTTGHFIVMVGTEDGKIRVNDPNSKTRSQQLWDYEDISGQIRNLWVCRLPS